MIEDRDQRYWQEYVATHLWYATRALMASGGLELTTPNYSEIMHPELQDTRTAAEIKDDILQKFKE